jgi:hypothetical protein
LERLSTLLNAHGGRRDRRNSAAREAGAHEGCPYTMTIDVDAVIVVIVVFNEIIAGIA